MVAYKIVAGTHCAAFFGLKLAKVGAQNWARWEN